MTRTPANFWITTPALLCLLCALSLAAWLRPAAAQDQAATWSLLRQPGHVAFMRHSEAPGYADPPGYNLDDCSTQRNLSTAAARTPAAPAKPSAATAFSSSAC